MFIFCLYLHLFMFIFCLCLHFVCRSHGDEVNEANKCSSDVISVFLRKLTSSCAVDNMLRNIIIIIFIRANAQIWKQRHESLIR